MADVQQPDGARITQEVEPLSNYFAGRVKKDLNGGHLVVGGILTSVARQLSDPFEPRLSQHAEFAGGDFQLTWKNRNYSLMGQYALTNVSGDQRLIASKQQRSSARYYQRPDRGTMSNGFFTNSYDTTLANLRGGGAYMRLGKDAGGWRWEAMLNVRTPGFETNDYSFLTTSDFIYTNANLVRNFTKPTKWYRSIWTSVGAQTQRNWDGDLTDMQLPVFFQITTPQFWNVNTFVILRPEVAVDRMLRGGPVVRKPANSYWYMHVSTDSRSKVVGNFGGSYAANSRGGWGSSVNAGVEVRPTSSMLISFNPSWSDSRSLLQYVRAVNDPTATDFHGSRYVLSDLKQKSLGLDTRLNVTVAGNDQPRSHARHADRRPGTNGRYRQSSGRPFAVSSCVQL